MNDQPIRSPLASQAMPESRRRALRGVLLDQVCGEVRPTRSARRAVVLPVAIGSAILVLGGGVAYSALTGSSSVTEHGTARCYTTATYQPGAKRFPGTTVAMADSAAAGGAVNDAAGICAELWRAGILQAGAPGPSRNPSAASYPVPQLVQCVLPNGSAAVFPGGTGLCARFGLSAAHPQG